MISLYRPAPVSWLHRRSAAHKLIALCALSVIILPLAEPVPLLALGLCVTLAYRSLGGGGVAEMRVVVSLWPWFLAMIAFHSFASHWVLGLVVVAKMALMILVANLLTLSTRQSDLLATLQRALSPLARLGLNTRALALAVSLVIRYVPVLLALFEQQRSAWQARGGRRRGRWKLLVPGLIAALRLADQVGEALYARGGVRGLR